MATPGRLVVTLARDGMSATAARRDAAPITLELIAAELRAAGVLFGLDDAAVGAAAASAIGRAVHVAQGLPMVPGIDGAFVPAFASGLLPGKVREDGSIDFHERDLVKSVVEGDALGTFAPPTPGHAGRRVDDTTVAAPDGKAARLKLGAGVLTGEDGTLRAGRTGVVVYVPGVSLDVTDHLAHRGDVDLVSGDLKVEGAVAIGGNVCAGCRVLATGNVEVRESVDGGSVLAGGDVSVRGTVRSAGGAAGAAGAAVWADGDVVVRSAEGAVIACRGTLRVAESVGSQLRGKRVEVMRQMRGGAALAEDAVIVQEAGAPDGTLTLLTAGEPIARAVGDVLSAVAAAKATRELGRQRSSATGPRGDGRAKGGRTGRAQATIETAELRERIALAARREVLVHRAFVHVAGTAHEGVVIQIGPARLNVEGDVRSTRFTFDAETRSIATERHPR
jgi:uncharacterized protein